MHPDAFCFRTNFLEGGVPKYKMERGFDLGESRLIDLLRSILG